MRQPFARAFFNPIFCFLSYHYGILLPGRKCSKQLQQCAYIQYDEDAGDGQELYNMQYDFS